MLSYLLRRLFWMFPTLVGITAVTFFVMAAAPGGLSAAALVEGQNLEPEAKQALLNYYNRLYGLDKPAWQQYLRWLNHISPVGWVQDANGQWRGPVFKAPDLGVSFRYGRPVTEILAERVPVTVLLNVLSLPIVYLSAIVIGVYAARHAGGRFDRVSSFALLSLWSAPTMLVGVLMVGFLASDAYLGWFPSGGLSRRTALDEPFLPVTPEPWQFWLLALLPLALGWMSLRLGAWRMGAAKAVNDTSTAAGNGATPAAAFRALGWRMLAAVGGYALGLAVALALVPEVRAGFLLDRLWHLVLPVLALSYGSLAFLAKLTRSSVLEQLSADYARTARAKGLSEHEVLWRHVFRNALLPLITVSASILPALIAGSVVVETIFSIDGMGRLAVEAVQTRDRELVLALTLMSGLLTLAGYLLADLAYAIADPRVSFER